MSAMRITSERSDVCLVGDSRESGLGTGMKKGRGIFMHIERLICMFPAVQIKPKYPRSY